MVYISNSSNNSFQKYSLKNRLLQLVGVLVSPTQTFQILKEKNFSLGINFYMILIFNFITSYFLSKNVVSSMEFQNMLPEELQNASSLSMFSLIISFFSIFQILFTVLVTSVIYFGIYKVSKYKISLKTVFIIVFLAQLITILGKLFNSFFMVGSENTIPITSLAFPFYANESFPLSLLNLLSYVDFFNIWSLLVISIGISVATNQSFKKTLGIMGIVLLITAIATSAIVLLMT